MNVDKGRFRKSSVCDMNPANIIVPRPPGAGKSRRRNSFQSKHHPRDRDFFVPDEVEEWVLPEYRSLFHHLFLRVEDDAMSQTGGVGSGVPSSSTLAPSASSALPRRKMSPSSGLTGSAPLPDEDGPLCNFVKSFPAWLKKVFHISDNNEDQQPTEEADRHAWLDEIPIEICDKLRHIHIYV